MSDLVAVALPAGPAFLDALRSNWHAGRVVLPIDMRLPPPRRAALLAEMAPRWLHDETGFQALSAPASDTAELTPLESGDALIMSTSGSTGTPKGVILTHDAIAAAGAATSAAVGVDPAADTWLCCLPTAHMGGLGVVLRAWTTSTPLIVHERFDPVRVMAAAAEGASLVSLVPAAVRRIDPGAFRTIVLGGSAIPPDRPANAVATYGLTETCGGVVYDGRPIDGVEMRIDPAGVGGAEILLRGPMLMRGYRRPLDPDRSAPISADGWFRTGDVGAIDADGVLSVRGRAGDLIITGGENVWPTPVETAISQHRAVAAVAVIGRPDPEWGQVVTAIVELGAGQAVTLDELRGTVKEQLPSFCAPQRLELRTLPRSSLGKVLRNEL